MIPLMKNAFLEEYKTKNELANFIKQTNKFSMGEQCALFETKFADFQGSKEGILLNSGGSACLVMLQILKNLGKINKGDKIGFSGLTWSTNVMPIIQLGFIPVPIDCDPTTLNVMSDNLYERIKDTDLKVFFLTNVLGFVGDIINIKKICDENGIFLIEDNCEALGTEINGKKTGTFGVMASHSFFIAHHMSTIEGGMIITEDEEFAEMARIVRANGWDRNLNSRQQLKWRRKYQIDSEFFAKYTFYDLAYNLRPTEITGFLGVQQLNYLKENISIREKNYLRLELEVKNNPDLVDMNHSQISLLSSFAFPVVCKSTDLKDRYLNQFSGAGIEVRPMIAGNMQNQPFYAKYVDENYDLPGVDELHENSFYCGNYPELTKSDLQIISSSLSKY
jgi:CDP-4-dehydro-6-deoxyglucose reductase, E1